MRRHIVSMAVTIALPMLGAACGGNSPATKTTSVPTSVSKPPPPPAPPLPGPPPTAAH